MKHSSGKGCCAPSPCVYHTHTGLHTSYYMWLQQAPKRCLGCLFWAVIGSFFILIPIINLQAMSTKHLNTQGWIVVAHLKMKTWSKSLPHSTASLEHKSGGNGWAMALKGKELGKQNKSLFLSGLRCFLLLFLYFSRKVQLTYIKRTGSRARWQRKNWEIRICASFLADPCNDSGNKRKVTI